MCEISLRQLFPFGKCRYRGTLDVLEAKENIWAVVLEKLRKRSFPVIVYARDPGKYFWIPMGSCILRYPGFSSQGEVTLHPRPSVLGLFQANAPYHPCPLPTPSQHRHGSSRINGNWPEKALETFCWLRILQVCPTWQDWCPNLSFLTEELRACEAKSLPNSH